MGLAPAIKPGDKTFVEPPGFLFCPCRSRFPCVSGISSAAGVRLLWQWSVDACLRHTPAMDVASIKQNKWVRRGIVALLSLLAFWAIAWLAVPPILKSQLQKIASEKLGRQVTVGKVDFKPWTLELTLNDLRIATADGSKPQVAIQRIYADAELQSVFRLAPVIDAVTMTPLPMSIRT